MNLIAIIGYSLLSIASVIGIFGMQRMYIIAKKANKKSSEKLLHYYCEACESDSTTYIKSINLTKEPPIIYRKCVKCAYTMFEEEFLWKHKKLILEDEWELAGTHRLSNFEEKQHELELKSEKFIPKNKILPFVCKKCPIPKGFATDKELRIHLRHLHGPKPKSKKPDKVDNVVDSDTPKTIKEIIPDEDPDDEPDEDDKSSLDEVEDMDIPLYEDDKDDEKQNLSR